jgi:hypothetical protein
MFYFAADCRSATVQELNCLLSQTNLLEGHHHNKRETTRRELATPRVRIYRYRAAI